MKKKRDIQQKQSIENMLSVMDFCHLQENLVINIVKNEWILQQKQEWVLQKLLLNELLKKLQKLREI